MRVGDKRKIRICAGYISRYTYLPAFIQDGYPVDSLSKEMAVVLSDIQCWLSSLSMKGSVSWPAFSRCASFFSFPAHSLLTTASFSDNDRIYGLHFCALLSSTEYFLHRLWSAPKSTCGAPQLQAVATLEDSDQDADLAAHRHDDGTNVCRAFPVTVPCREMVVCQRRDRD